MFELASLVIGDDWGSILELADQVLYSVGDIVAKYLEKIDVIESVETEECGFEVKAKDAIEISR